MTALTIEKTGTRAVSEPLSGDASSLMEVIGRAARDPNTDVDKLERLMGLYERVEGRKAEQAFNDAMNAAQTDIRPIAADASNPQTRSTYASYHALDRAVRPIYTKHGFSLSFDTGAAAHDSHIKILCYVSHKDGHSRTYQADVPADGKGAKGGDVMTKTHAMGSAMSYGQRYLLKLIFNIVVGDDDDGNRAGGGDGPIDQMQMDKLRDLIERTGTDIEKFCAFMKVEALKDITVKSFPRAIEALNMKARKK